MGTAGSRVQTTLTTLPSGQQRGHEPTGFKAQRRGLIYEPTMMAFVTDSEQGSMA